MIKRREHVEISILVSADALRGKTGSSTKTQSESMLSLRAIVQLINKILRSAKKV